MFAIPGICALIIFVLTRPQEFFTLLQRVPFLHLFALFALLGYVIDTRLRKLQPIAVPSLPWVLAFIGWGLVCCAVKVPDTLIARAVELAILFTLYGTLAHGVQRFRMFQIVATALAVACLFITLLCFIEGRADHQCIGGVAGEGGVVGEPDGRDCETREECTLGPGARPTLDYRCEHVGFFNMYSIENRTRYIGELNDPNEVALVISTGAFSVLIAFLRRRSTPLRLLTLGSAVIMVLWTVLMTQSRGGMLTAMIVPGVYVVRRFGIKALIPAAFLVLPVMALSGRGNDASADESTMLRYEAWSAGLQMFRESPIFGVGPRQFANHHFITAHNSYVLVLSETGITGLFLFVSILFVTTKSLIVGLRTLRPLPGTEVATVWGMALLASMLGMMFQISTLSFAYHSSTWIQLGMSGAWYSCVKTHKPDFKVKLVGRDFAIIALIVVAYAFVILPIFLRRKGF